MIAHQLHAHHHRQHQTVPADTDAGTVTAFVTVLAVALLAIAGLVLDTGLALSTKTEALDQAQAAARTGAQQLDLTGYRTTGAARLDPDQAAAAARDWLATHHLRGTVSASPDTVTVTVRRTHRTQMLGLIGIHTLTMTASATATPQQQPGTG